MVIDAEYCAARAEAYIARNRDGGSALWLADDVLRLAAEIKRSRAAVDPVLASLIKAARATYDRAAEAERECQNPRFDHLVRGGGKRYRDGADMVALESARAAHRVAVGQCHRRLDAIIRGEP